MAPRRYELSDQQYERIHDLLAQPPTSSRGRPRPDDRQILNGIFWILCSGAAWRDIPQRYGPWKTVYDRYRRWVADGTIDRLLQRLHLQLDEEGYINHDTWFADSTSVRATRAASGAVKKKARESGSRP